MKTFKALFLINLSFAIFLAVGWIYFYAFIIMDDISRMPRALMANAAIAGLNAVFLISLVLLPFTYRSWRKRK